MTTIRTGNTEVILRLERRLAKAIKVVEAAHKWLVHYDKPCLECDEDIEGAGCTCSVNVATADEGLREMRTALAEFGSEDGT
jgi:hypothetical protein